jgi:hypothetical protein
MRPLSALSRYEEGKMGGKAQDGRLDGFKNTMKLPICSSTMPLNCSALLVFLRSTEAY